MKICINIRIIRTRMISSIIWAKWRSVKSSRKTKCLLMASKTFKVIDFEASHYLFVAWSDSNKRFQEDRRKTVGTFPQFCEAAPWASDERAKKGTDPKHFWTPLRLLELEINSPGRWGGQRSLWWWHQHRCGPQMRQQRTGRTWGPREAHLRLWTRIGWSMHDEAYPNHDE